MKETGVAVFCALLCTVLSLSLKVKEEHKTAFFGEDVHIALPSVDGVDVLFKPVVSPTSEEVLLRGGTVAATPRQARINTLHRNLILEDVSEEDEGMYVIKNLRNPADVKHIILVVRDCSLENVVKYGETYYFPLDSVAGPITLEFRPSQAAQLNQTGEEEPPAVVLWNQTAAGLAPGYQGRLYVTEKRVTLHRARGADEGSFTVLDRDGKVRKRNCLNVREHQTFVRLSYGDTLKINLYLDHTQVSVQYTAESDQRERTLVDQGAVVPLDPALDGRLSVEGSLVVLEKVRLGDMGQFVVTDLVGFRVANIYLEVEAYKLPSLYVVILSLLGLLVLLLLLCLASCLIKTRQRAEKSRKITLIAQQAGRGDGDAFRQVVQDAYTKFTEDSTKSTWDNVTETTEVTIKGLEVSKGGRYHNLSPSAAHKNFLEMSDSGVEFNSSTLPLDSDTDVPVTFASHKLHPYSEDHAADTVAEDEEEGGASSARATPPQAPEEAESGDPAAPENT